MKTGLFRMLRWVGVLVILAIVVGLGVLLYLSYFEGLSVFADSLVALGTMLLAAATFILAFLTRKSMNEAAKKEGRERSARVLAEIRGWAEEAARAAISRQTRTEHELWAAKLKYKYSLAVSAYIITIAESFKNLKPFLSDVLLKLDCVVEATKKEIDHKGSVILSMLYD